MLRDDINNALKDAMKARDERRVSTLRLVNSALKNADIEARGQSKAPLGDDELLALLAKMIKQRHESIDLYEKGGRAELAQQERDEIAIIAAYMPKQMSDAEVRTAITQAIADTGATSMKDMGKVIAALKALSDASGLPSNNRESQCDVVLVEGRPPCSTAKAVPAATGRRLGGERYTDMGRQILSPKGPRSLD